MLVNTNILGFIAAVCTTVAFVPQALLVWRQRAAPGVSTGMYVIFVTGIALWLWYGLQLSSWPLIIANSLTLLLAGSILTMKLVFERKRKLFS
jgi:MtN3 and saliva related transmembrane protein